MKTIRPEDINSLNDIIMDLPAFAELKSRDMIQDLLNHFMKDLYIDQPKELFDALEFELSSRMQETFFANYGIDKSYSKKLKGYLKKDISYQLEVLYQNKGSRVLFKMFADIFESIFRRINFYNIKVFKIPIDDGFRYEYRLVPLHITDSENILKYPQVSVEQSRKYLMDLENFEDYTMWPMPTNLVYIQFTIGEEVINNHDTFLDGVRGYGTTYLQDKTMPYKNRFGYVETISLADAELITNYFKVEITKRSSPEWEFDIPMNMSTFLAWDGSTVGNVGEYPEHAEWTSTRIEFLQNLQRLMKDYGEADRRDRDEMSAVKRRWQMFMKLKEKAENTYNTYDAIASAIQGKYPLMFADFNFHLDKTEIDENDNESLFDFYIYIYSIFLNGTFSQPEAPEHGLDQEIVVDYIDVLFGNLFIEAGFLKWYFNPVMDLFIRYFFPVEMEYINDLITKIFINDKFNAISYNDDGLQMEVHSRQLTPHAYRIGLDKTRFDMNITRWSRVEPLSMPRHNIIIPTISELDIEDSFRVIDLA